MSKIHIDQNYETAVRGFALAASSVVPLSLREALKLALDQLAGLAADCRECDGNGWVGERFEAYLMTDDRRQGQKRGAITRQSRVLNHGPEVDPVVRGAGLLKSPCRECLPLRQVIETAGRSL